MVADIITAPDQGSTLLPRTVTDMIFEDVARTSVVQQLARRINLPAAGVAIPVTLTKPTAAWVAETSAKPVSDATLDTKLMDPKKIATIIVFSKEYLQRDVTGLFRAIRPQIAEAFGDAFDAAAIHGDSSPFTNYLAETSHTVALGTTAAADGGAWVDLVTGLAELVNDRKRLTGFAADPMAEPVLMASVDGNGRPLLVDTNSEGISQRLMGRPIGFGEGVNGVAGDKDTLLVGGDWRQAVYGVGTEITYDVSTEASIVMPDSRVVNLWQDNLVALRAEAEYGLVIGDVDAFVLYTGSGFGAS